MTPAQPSSVRPGEVDKFNRLAATWWDPNGPMAALHAMNPARIAWIAAQLTARKPGHHRILDVGSGAGLAAEALAAIGHHVLGIDAAPDAIAAAQSHAAETGSPATYRCTTPETLAAEGRTFPVITALEVIEHVADPATFLRTLAALLEPGGLLVISTISRTLRALAVAKLGAEYVARLLPRGTHDWRRFLTPADLARAARPAHLHHLASTGLAYDLRRRTWTQSPDLSINYLALFTRLPPKPHLPFPLAR